MNVSELTTLDGMEDAALAGPAPLDRLQKVFATAYVDGKRQIGVGLGVRWDDPCEVDDAVNLYDSRVHRGFVTNIAPDRLAAAQSSCRFLVP